MLDEPCNYQIKLFVFGQICEINFMKVPLFDIFCEGKFVVKIVGIFQQRVYFFIMPIELVISSKGDLFTAFELIGQKLFIADIELIFSEFCLNGIKNFLIQGTKFIESHFLPRKWLYFLTHFQIRLLGSLSSFGLSSRGQRLKIYFRCV